MSYGSERHRQAAQRHEQAASNHDRSATFWDQQGNQEQAGLQRELGEHERQGAELERRWAEMMDRKMSPAARPVASARGITRTNAAHLCAELERTANALEETAAIAEQHAKRREQTGHSDAAQEERRIAENACNSAQRARAQAEEWRKLAKQT